MRHGLKRILGIVSQRSRHFFYKISNVRPLGWMLAYILLIPVFAIIYSVLPAGEFRMPDGIPGGFGSWIYYSVVTISTLGFGDITPAGWWAQFFTAIEVLCGIALMGFFLNAVSWMRSYREPTTHTEKRRRRRIPKMPLHNAHRYHNKKEKMINGLK